jgi:hypothetical protein
MCVVYCTRPLTMDSEQLQVTSLGKIIPITAATAAPFRGRSCGLSLVPCREPNFANDQPKNDDASLLGMCVRAELPRSCHAFTWMRVRTTSKLNGQKVPSRRRCQIDKNGCAWTSRRTTPRHAFLIMRVENGRGQYYLNLGGCACDWFGVLISNQDE